MADTFFESIREILSIQRWNFVPRVDEWSEAENIAYYSHLAFAISKCFSLSEKEITNVLCRCLLKSYNKHCLSDIPISSRDAIKEHEEKAWIKIVDDAAEKTSKFFPKELKEFISDYMKYELPGKIDKFKEEIIKYCQYKSAWEECEYNAKVFSIPKYDEIKCEINGKLSKLAHIDKFENNYTNIAIYAQSIRILKHVRRWNRLNRNIQSSVMAHTFVVSILALYFAKLEGKPNNFEGDHDNFIYECLVRALFHDVQESITGDIISPVKEIINREKPTLWNEVENSMMHKFLDNVPPQIREEIKRFNLLHLSNIAPMNSSESLVKECDKFALVLECVFEKRSGNRQTEMLDAQIRYINDLRNSEWPRIREYTGRVIDEYSMTSSRQSSVC